MSVLSLKIGNMSVKRRFYSLTQELVSKNVGIVVIGKVYVALNSLT